MISFVSANQEVMKKAIIICLLIGSIYQLKAQGLQTLKPADSLSSLLQSPYIKALPESQWNLPQPMLYSNGYLIKPVTTANGTDYMPIAVLKGNSKMPVAKLYGRSKIPIVPIDQKEPCTVVRKWLPGMPAFSTPDLISPSNN